MSPSMLGHLRRCGS